MRIGSLCPYDECIPAVVFRWLWRSAEQRVEALRQRLTADLATAGVRDDGQIAEALDDTDIRKICDPDLVGLIRVAVPIKVGMDRVIMPAVGCADEASPHPGTRQLLHPP
jgi:hypothetical protein